MTAGWDHARAVADAVLYEGYLLYPYRANSRKNQSRWQFGVLGPQGAADAGIGEDDTLSAQVLVRVTAATRRSRAWCGSCSCSTAACRARHRRRPLRTGRRTGHRVAVVAQLGRGRRSARSRSDRFASSRVCRSTLPISRSPRAPTSRCVDGGRLVRTRRALHGQLDISARARRRARCGSRSTVRNTAPPAADKDEAIADLADRHASARRGHRRGVRVAAGTAGFGRRSGGAVPAAPLLPGACRTARRP